MTNIQNQHLQKPTVYFIRVKHNWGLSLSANEEDSQAIQDMLNSMKDRVAGQSFGSYEELQKELDAATPQHKYDLTTVCDSHKFREPPYMSDIGFACFAVVNTHPDILFLQSNGRGFTCFDDKKLRLDFQEEDKFCLNVQDTLSLWQEESDHYNKGYVLHMFDLFCKSDIESDEPAFTHVVVNKSIHMDKVIGEGVHSQLVNEHQHFYQSHYELDFSSNTSLSDAAIRLLDAGYKLFNKDENRLYHCSFHPGVLRYEKKPRFKFSATTETELASLGDVLKFYFCA